MPSKTNLEVLVARGRQARGVVVIVRHHRGIKPWREEANEKVEHVDTQAICNDVPSLRKPNAEKVGQQQGAIGCPPSRCVRGSLVQGILPLSASPRKTKEEGQER